MDKMEELLSLCYTKQELKKLTGWSDHTINNYYSTRTQVMGAKLPKRIKYLNKQYLYPKSEVIRFLEEINNEDVHTISLKEIFENAKKRRHRGFQGA